MRLTSNICVHKKCNKSTMAGFRFCYSKNCGKHTKPQENEGEEE